MPEAWINREIRDQKDDKVGKFQRTVEIEAGIETKEQRVQTMTLQAHVGADGILKLEVPIGMADVELDVVVTFHPRSATPAAMGNLLPFIGAIDDPTFVRAPQGAYETRKPLE